MSGSGNQFLGGYAVVFTGTPTVDLVNNTYAANAIGPAVRSLVATTPLRISGIEIDHPATGFAAVVAERRNYGANLPVGAYRQGALSSGAAYIQADAGYSLFGQAAPADVRFGMIYANGQLVGTMQAVSPTPQQIWEYATRSLTDKAGFELTSGANQAISDRMERTGSPLKTTSNTIAAVKTRLENTATTEVVQQIVADTLGAL
jgi:hypothetical protein